MINHDAIRLLDWYFQQPDILTKDKNVFSKAPEIINAPSHKPDPVFNHQVSLVFQRPFTPEETTTDHQIAVHTDRSDTYQALQNHPVIEAFRNHFNRLDCKYYEILDIVFWRLGVMLDTDGLELTPGEFLREHGQ